MTTSALAYIVGFDELFEFVSTTWFKWPATMVTFTSNYRDCFATSNQGIQHTELS